MEQANSLEKGRSLDYLDLGMNMNLLLGIDTGGTYTDAVILESSSKKVLAKAKALTTHQQLEVGISEAIGAVLKESAIDTKNIALVSVSTTLATNAVVEGISQKSCAVLIGMEKAIRPELEAVLEQHNVVYLSGGHDGSGQAVDELSLSNLEAFLAEKGDSVSAFALTSYFSVRNPEHELAAKKLIMDTVNKPVTCSHELAHALNASQRAVTCVLNAGLIGMIDDFINAIENSLKTYGVAAPLMIVKGDGSLIAAEEAKKRPVETMLSGPAASLVGASYLADAENAIISDIGGTTTDIAILTDGQPKLRDEGISIAGWRTMVKAVDMHTFGLGGDSQVSLVHEGLVTKISLGPRRVIPISLFAKDNPELVHNALDRQLESMFPREHDGEFVKLISEARASDTSLSTIEQDILNKLANGPTRFDDIIENSRSMSAVSRLLKAKRIAISAFTPSDASHVVGGYDIWDGEAAKKAAQIFANRRNNKGLVVAESPEELSNWVIDTLKRRSAEVILDTAFVADGSENSLATAKELSAASQHPLIKAALNKQYSIIDLSLGINLPVIGLGASAATYYPAVGDILNTKAVIPEHAEVANAIGAVVGLVRSTIKLNVSTPAKNTFRVHAPQETTDFSHLNEAISFAEDLASKEAKQHAEKAGAGDIEVQLSRIDKKPVIGGKELFLESEITAVAFGRPSF